MRWSYHTAATEISGPHGQEISVGAIIQLLQRSLDHAGLVTHSHELVTSLDTVESDLTNNLVKALRVKLLADGANSVGSSAKLIQLLVQSLLQVENICTRGWCGRNVTHPQLVVLDHLLGR